MIWFLLGVVVTLAVEWVCHSPVEAKSLASRFWTWLLGLFHK